MADLDPAVQALRLYGMARRMPNSSRTVRRPGANRPNAMLRHLLQAEMTDRGLRSIRYQMHAARFPVHRDLAGFVFEHSKLDRRQIEPSPRSRSPRRPRTSC
jgi:hypothetical protein